MHFYSMLNHLPGGSESNRGLRWSLAQLLINYPSSVKKPLAVLQKFLKEHKRWGFQWQYGGDIETDFLRFLGKVQKAVKDNPINVDAILGSEDRIGSIESLELALKRSHL